VIILGLTVGANIGKTVKAAGALARADHDCAAYKEPVPSLEEKRAQRLRFMRLLYEATEGDTMATLEPRQLGDELELSAAQTENLVQFLVDEGLVEWVTFGQLGITHRGVVEVEQALTKPNQPTQHFPPAVNIINVQGSVVGSQIQQATTESSQVLEPAPPDVVEAVRLWAAKVREDEASLKLTTDALDALDTELAVLETRLHSSSPKRPLLRASVETVGSILRSATAGAAAMELVKELPHLIQLLSHHG
jgi:hypothetical protein